MMKKKKNQVEKEDDDINSNKNFSTMKTEEVPPRLRILMVSDFFHPSIGGVESHMYHLAQNLMRRGHHVVIYTHAYEQGSYCGVTYFTNGLKVYYVPRKSIYQAATLPTIFGGFSKLREVILSERIDLVHAHQAFSAMANEAVIHARTMNIPTVFTDHSLFGFADLASIMMNKALKFSLADVQRVICVSHTSRENTVLRACVPPRRVYVVPNAVDMTAFYPSPHASIEDLRQADNTIVVMSRLVYRKGIDLLIRILPVVCQKHPQVRFVIGGDGPKRQELVDAIRECNLESRVTLKGAIPHADVRDFLSQGSIFLNCSLTEAFCVALVEAAAVGLTIVSTSVGGVPEVLPSTMMVLADASADGIVQALDKALSRVASSSSSRGTFHTKEDDDKEDDIEKNRELTRRFRQAQEQHAAVTGMYSWSVVARRTEHVYHDAMRDKTSVYKRLCRYYQCGKWFGKLCILIAITDWLLLILLEYIKPKRRIKPAKDFPRPYT